MRSARSDRRAEDIRDAGSVTAEVAVTLPVVVLALAVVLFAGSVAQAGVTCVDTARAAGRALARGEGVASATGAARQVAGRPVAVQVGGPGQVGDVRPAEGGGEGLVVVTVKVEVAGVPVPSWSSVEVWRVPVTCHARAWQEPAG